MASGNFNAIKYAQVVSVEDENGAGRIRVHLMPDDANLKDAKDHPYAIPLLPKHLSVVPKVGEGVFVINAVVNEGKSQRYYIGPVISQGHRLGYDPYFMGGDSILPGAPKEFEPFEKVAGVYGDDDDIVISGRKNCDVLIRKDDIQLRAGVKVFDNDDKNKVYFNQTHPSYLKLKYHPTAIDGIKSTATVVADRIMLLSNNSATKQNGNGTFTLASPPDNKYPENDLIREEEMKKVFDEAYKLPYGEMLVDFLKKFMDVFISHTHNFIGLPPNAYFIDQLQSAAADPIINKKMLSDSIRIN